MAYCESPWRMRLISFLCLSDEMSVGGEGNKVVKIYMYIKNIKQKKWLSIKIQQVILINE